MAFKHFVLAAGFAAFCSSPVLADELPTPKAGLWETTVLSGAKEVMTGGYKQCMDGKIDLEGLMRATGGMCDLKWRRLGDDQIETETNCRIGPISAKGKGMVTGDFNSKLHIETTTKVSMEGMPGGAPQLGLPKEEQSMVVEATWIGPCEPGQKGGDFITPDGRIVRLQEAPGAASR